MDTWIWGPMVWRLLEDVSYEWDSQFRVIDTLQSLKRPKVVINDKVINGNVVHFMAKQSDLDEMTLFLTSLAYVLPCIHCRGNYRRHLSAKPFESYLKSGRLLRWIFELHETVNEETLKQTFNERVQVNLKTKTDNSFGFAILVKKLEVYSSSCTVQNLLDFLYIIAENLPVTPEDMTHEDKKTFHKVFLRMLPKVTERHPVLTHFSQTWQKQLVKLELTESSIIQSDVSMVTFLNDLDRVRLIASECAAIPQMLQKFNKANAQYLPNVSHWYS